MNKISFLLILTVVLLLSKESMSQCASASNIHSFVYNGVSYEVVRENLSWEDAAACAVQRGGILTEINDQSEQDAVFNALSNAGINDNLTRAPDGGDGAYVWIGGNDLAVEGEWIWDGGNTGSGVQFWMGTASGSSVGGLYNNWGNEPDDYEGQDALGLSLDGWPQGVAGEWNDVDHLNTLYYVIEYDMLICTPTSSNIMVTACESYTSPSGNDVWTVSGTYMDVITNANGCDSTITIVLDIAQPVQITDTQTACDSYTWVDGMTYTSSNSSAQVILTSSAGCDSTVTLDLTILESTSSVDEQSACDNFTWINGVTYTSSNFTDQFTLTGSNGCDSVVQLALTIHPSFFVRDIQEACDSYTWIDGVTYTSSNNSASVLLTSVGGCDSIIALDLTILGTSSVVYEQFACDSYTWIDGVTYTASTDTPTVLLTSTSGCDSIVRLDLTISDALQTTDTQQACDSYTWIDGMTYTASTDTPTVLLTSTSGCDSIVRLDLTVTEINQVVNRINDTLVSAQMGATYQWIDCNTNNSPIAGATMSSFAPTATGDYAVIINLNGCIDTSECINVIIVNTEDQLHQSAIHVYPNPSLGTVYLSIDGLTGVSYRVIDLRGQVIYQGDVPDLTPQKINIQSGAGLYLVHVRSDQGYAVVKLWVQ